MTAKQNDIVLALENLVLSRFNKETLEAKLSEIFEEPIRVELGYEDVEDFPDWDFMFQSDNEEFGGDFDIYVLKHRNIDSFGNEFMVTGIGYDFYN